MILKIHQALYYANIVVKR